MKNKPPAAETGTPTPGAQAVRRVMAVLRVVAGSPPPRGIRLKDVVAQVGLSAAFLLAASEYLPALAQLTSILACLAATSVAVWFVGAAFRVYYYRARLAVA